MAYARAPFAFIALFATLPTTTSGNTACGEVRDHCGRYKKGSKVVEGLAGARNGDGEVVVMDLEHLTSDACGPEHLRQLCRSGDHHCEKAHECPPDEIPGFAARLVYIQEAIVMFLVAMFLAVKCGCVSSQREEVLLVAIYWYGDFWAGVVANALAIMKFTHGMQFSIKFVFLNLTAAQFIEFLIYDGWLLLLAKVFVCKCLFVVVALALGAMWGVLAVCLAYMPSSVAILGHHVIMLGMFNFFLDILKAAALKNLKKRFCEGDKSIQVYEPVWTGLTHVLPGDEISGVCVCLT